MAAKPSLGAKFRWEFQKLSGEIPKQHSARNKSPLWAEEPIITLQAFPLVSAL